VRINTIPYNDTLGDPAAFIVDTHANGFSATSITVDLDYAAKENRIALEWTYEKGVSYKLYRAVASFDPAIGDSSKLTDDTLIGVGAWAEISASIHGEIEYSTATTTNGTTGIVTGTARAYDVDVPFRQSYRYKIVASKDFAGVPVAATPAYAYLVSYPFNRISQLIVTAAPDTKVYHPERQIRVTVASANLADISATGDVVELYRSVSSVSTSVLDQQFESTPVKKYTAADLATANNTYTEIGEADKFYRYKAVVKIGTETLINQNGQNIVTTGIPTTNVARFGSIFGPTAPTLTGAGATGSRYVLLQIPDSSANTNLKGKTLQIRYRLSSAGTWDVTAGQVTGWTNIATTVYNNPTTGLPEGLQYVQSVSLGATFPALVPSTSYDFQLRLITDPLDLLYYVQTFSAVTVAP
jgi:hypothetical protein